MKSVIKKTLVRQEAAGAVRTQHEGVSLAQDLERAPQPGGARRDLVYR